MRSSGKCPDWGTHWYRNSSSWHSWGIIWQLCQSVAEQAFTQIFRLSFFRRCLINFLVLQQTIFFTNPLNNNINRPTQFTSFVPLKKHLKILEIWKTCHTCFNCSHLFSINKDSCLQSKIALKARANSDFSMFLESFDTSVKEILLLTTPFFL